MLWWVKKGSLNKSHVLNKRHLSQDPKEGEKASHAKNAGKRILGIKNRK